MNHSLPVRLPLLLAIIFSLASSLGHCNPQTISKTANSSQAKEEVLPAVLPPEQFFGPAAMGYAAAKGCSGICSKLFCYCGCDITDNHKSLLDCFTSFHGVDCHICQEEALLAKRLANNNESLAAIQQAVDQAYARMYPFKSESPALVHYKSIRSWSPQLGASSIQGTGSKDTCCSGN